jgi:moderate conductance mechanosensitive channel
MGDYAIRLRMKVMTKPGEQFAVRRAVYAKIKKAFAAADIRFAFPTVSVAGGGEGQQQGEAVTAAARQVLEQARQAQAAAE